MPLDPEKDKDKDAKKEKKRKSADGVDGDTAKRQKEDDSEMLCSTPVEYHSTSDPQFKNSKIHL